MSGHQRNGSPSKMGKLDFILGFCRICQRNALYDADQILRRVMLAQIAGQYPGQTSSARLANCRAESPSQSAADFRCRPLRGLCQSTACDEPRETQEINNLGARWTVGPGAPQAVQGSLRGEL
jgi:hypothetical protein